MGNRRASGLTKRGGVWHVDKMFRGVRIRESTGTGEVVKAQAHLARRIDQIRERQLFGQRADRTFRAAAAKFLEEHGHKRSIGDDAMHLRQLDPFIGELLLPQVHMGSLQPFVSFRRAKGVKANTINQALAVVRRILNLAATEWRDEAGLTWLEHAAKIKLLNARDARAPYPLSAEEQSALFAQLPRYLARMALFKVNTGCREQEVCRLKWCDEVRVPELGTSVFIVSADEVKNGQERLIVLNSVARSIIEAVRGEHEEFVFVRDPACETMRTGRAGEAAAKPHPLKRMNNTAWKSARERAADEWQRRTQEPAPQGFRRVRVHDLKHTFGRRLRAAGVSYEDRQDLLGHKSGRITTHYSAAELSNLIEAAERVCGENSRKSPACTLLKRRAG